MYVLASNQTVEKFPYSIDGLKTDHPNTSFPANPSLETLASYNVFPVVSTSVDFDAATQVAMQEGCIYSVVYERWETSWTVRNMAAEETQQRDSEEASEVRTARNKKLADSDWTQIADSPADKAAWATYRQSLRNVPSQAGFPWTIEWPTQP